MKKTLTINLNGRVFNIDEDAYELLDKYLRNLRIYFRKDEGYAEIIADFEGRIEELFSERVRLGHEVISIDQVETIIKQVGRPEDFGDSTENPDAKDSESTKKDDNYYHSSSEKKATKKLYRNIDNKLLGGVISGIATYFDWDVTITRLIVVCVLIAGTFVYGCGIWMYVIVWIIVPAARTAQQKLEMRGEEVNPENIGKIVTESNASANIKSENKGCIGWVLDFFVSLIKVFLVGIGILIGIPIIFALIIVLIVVFAVLLGVGGGLVAFPFIGHDLFNITVAHPTIALIATIFIAAIPLFLLIYSIVAYFAKLSPLPKSVKLTGLIVWLIAVVVLIFSGFNIDFNKSHRHGWHVNWSDPDHHDAEIKGNGELTDRVETIPYFDTIKLDEDLAADIQLEENSSDTTKLLINGESNIIDKVKWSVDDNELKLYVEDGYQLNTNSGIIIKATAPVFKGVKIESVGSVRASRKLQADNFFVNINGAGNFQADSLYCNTFNADLEGLGNVDVSGKASKAFLKLKGAGKINALNFNANEIEALMNGVGAIKCNPLQRIDATVNGIGQISYKNEPATKHTNVNGMGKIGKE